MSDLPSTVWVAWTMLEVGVTVAVRVTATVTGHRRRGVDEHDVALALPPGAVTPRKLIEGR